MSNYIFIDDPQKIPSPRSMEIIIWEDGTGQAKLFHSIALKEYPQVDPDNPIMQYIQYNFPIMNFDQLLELIKNFKETE